MKKFLKKEYNINGVLFQIYSDSMDEVDSYFKNFTVPCQEEVKSIYQIYYDDDPIVLERLIKQFDVGSAYEISTFKNQKHYQIGNQFLIDTRDYFCIKEDDHHYQLFGSVKGLSWVVRELLIREMEDENYYYMHGTGVKVEDKGILLLGNSGSGKTTFLSKLIMMKSKKEMISNDRVFVKDGTMHYYPISIWYAMGTVKNNPALSHYFDKHYPEFDYKNAQDMFKFRVPLTDVSNIFSNIKNVDQSKIDLIIFPKLSKEEKINSLSKEEAISKLEEVNFTPNDTENERKEWIRYRNISLEEIEKNKKDFHEDLSHIPMVEVEYKKETDCKTIEKILRKVL